MQTKLKRLGSILLSLFMFIGSINLPCNVLPVMAALDSSVKPTSIQSISPVTMAPGETKRVKNSTKESWMRESKYQH